MEEHYETEGRGDIKSERSGKKERETKQERGVSWKMRGRENGRVRKRDGNEDSNTRLKKNQERKASLFRFTL